MPVRVLKSLCKLTKCYVGADSRDFPLLIIYFFIVNRFASFLDRARLGLIYSSDVCRALSASEGRGMAF